MPCVPNKLQTENDQLALFQASVGRIAEGDRLLDMSALAEERGITMAQLDDLFRDHAHLSPQAWLQRRQIESSARALIGGSLKLAEIGAKAGFENDRDFAKVFLKSMGMTPDDYRALGARPGFSIELPKGYRPGEILRYHARDPDSLSERSRDNRIWKALDTPDGPVVLELTIGASRVAADIHAERKIGRDSIVDLHEAALRMLGLANGVADFEKEHSAFAAPRRGLRLPLLPRGFDALCWAIIGQQINVRFAGALRRDMIALAGQTIGDMRVHPTPQAVANLDLSALTSRRYSGSKARYLIDAAQACASDALDIESLHRGSAIAAEQALLAQRGIGVWTARYVLLRVGFADAAPVGDSGLATALQRLHQLPARPDAAQTARLMSEFAPHGSLATMHLWSSLKPVLTVSPARTGGSGFDRPSAFAARSQARGKTA